MNHHGNRWVVLKFGGTSVATLAGWRTIREACVRVARSGRHVLVVCSALAGVSDRLEELILAASEGREYLHLLHAVQEAHQELAGAMEIPLPEEVADALEELRRSLQGIALLRDVSPPVQARVLALGELMATRLGVAWLRDAGVAAAWADARILLDVHPQPGWDARSYLSATVVAEPDPSVRGALPDAPVVVTQGFIASNDDDETVLLGRGGSDTSATSLAARIGAERVEIWTDVPGLFTANPRRVPEARHLGSLNYEEAAAMASLGACVLHPRSIRPARDAGIPIHVRSTYVPFQPGTVVEAAQGGVTPGVRAVTHRKGLALLRLCRPSQWQPVGFVADVSSCFKHRGLSIDLMSTSPSTLAVTVDPTSSSRQAFDAVLADLEQVADVRLEEPVASVSLVGSGVREAFDRVGGAIQRLEGVSIAMVAQGAADHHLTFVVPEPDVDELVKTLHKALFVGRVGPTFRDLDRASAELVRV